MLFGAGGETSDFRYSESPHQNFHRIRQGRACSNVLRSERRQVLTPLGAQLVMVSRLSTRGRAAVLAVPLADHNYAVNVQA